MVEVEVGFDTSPEDLLGAEQGKANPGKAKAEEDAKPKEGVSKE